MIAGTELKTTESHLKTIIYFETRASFVVFVRYANVFLHPVTDDEAPGYHNVIYRYSKICYENNILKMFILIS